MSASPKLRDRAEREPDARHAALILLVREMDLEKVLPQIHEPGHVIQTSLSGEVEAQLDAALAAPPAASRAAA